MLDGHEDVLKQGLPVSKGMLELILQYPNLVRCEPSVRVVHASYSLDDIIRL